LTTDRLRSRVGGLVSREASGYRVRDPAAVIIELGMLDPESKEIT
jgi:hypothetical protein